MSLGWIDNSKSERNKALSVMALLSEKGTLDELGIAPVRDGDVGRKRILKIRRAIKFRGEII